jgi:hypothetical protein
MKYTTLLIKVNISLILFYVGYKLVEHGSSSAFELGFFCFFLAVFHGAFWKLPNEK